MAIIEKYYLKYQSELQVYFDRLVEMYISKWVPSHRPMISMYHGTLLIFRYRTLEIKLDSLIIEDDLVRIEYQDDNTGFMQIQDLYDIKLEILKKDNKRTLSF